MKTIIILGVITVLWIAWMLIDHVVEPVHCAIAGILFYLECKAIKKHSVESNGGFG